MTDAGVSGTTFGVETIELDLPPLVGALSRRLYERGLPVTPARAAAFARALTLVRPVARRRLYWTARTVFVTDPSQLSAFDDVFFSVFGNDDVRVPEDTRAVTAPPRERPRAEQRSAVRSAEVDEGVSSFARGGGPDDDDDDPTEVPVALASNDERLAEKHFDALEPHELAQVYRLMARLQLATPPRRTRRYEKGRHGEHIDMRRTLRQSLRSGGDPIRLARRRRRIARRRLVLLCDISGSMESYARVYLQFLASAAGSGANTEAFVFATRLTRVTRALTSRNPHRAIERAAAAAPDWSSGTRIGDALKEFNDRHGRRGMARGAVIVVLSDGWERGDPMIVGREMERLARLAHRIVWVNPRAGAAGFTVRSGGMVAALPHCDALVSGHSFRALGEVVDAIGAESWEPPAPQRTLEEDEPWPSATPAPGSSVAMPSGYGPSRGNTSPGWVRDE